MTLRIYATEDFTDDDGLRHGRGAVSSDKFFLEIPCTFDDESNLITIPEFEHPIPTNLYGNIRFNAVLYRTERQILTYYQTDYRLPDGQTATTWESIRIHNNARAPYYGMSGYLNQDQTQTLVNEAINNIVLPITGVSLTAYGNSLAAAIADIGSAETVLFIPSNTTVSSAVTVPSNVILKPYNHAKIIKSGSGTITFQGIGVESPLSAVPIFSGFSAGNITWTGSEYPAQLSADLWESASVSTKANNAIAAMNGKQCKIILTAGNFTGTVTVTSGIELFLSRGTYTQSSTGIGFILQSNTKVCGAGRGQTFVTENATTPAIVRASGVASFPFDGTNENIEICDIGFIGNPLCPVDSSQSAVFLGNARNSSVHHCLFSYTHGFAAYVGAFATSGYQAENCFLVDNICEGLQTQNMGTVGGQNVHISRNVFTVNSRSTSPFLAVIDIEPNANTYGSDNIFICDNIIDGRAAQQNFNGIVVQKAYGGNLRHVEVSRNQIIGTNAGRLTFRDADINLATDTVTIYAHGLETGQPILLQAIPQFQTLPAGIGGAAAYVYAIKTGIDTIKFASTYANAIAGTAINITGAGYGKYQLAALRSMSNGISIAETAYAVVDGNLILGASQTGITSTFGYRNIIRDNTIAGCGGGGSNAMYLTGCVDSRIERNRILSAPGDFSQDTSIIETDLTLTVSTVSGSPNVTVTTDQPIAWWFRGLTINIGGSDYVIAERYGDKILELTSNAASTLTGVTATLKASTNKYRDNECSSITTSANGSSVVYSNFTDFRKSGTVTIDPASIGANTVASQTFTLTGASVGDTLILNPPSTGLTAGLLVQQSYVSAANTITVVFQNTTASPINEASASWIYTISR